jgi:exodeoxyribonuclease VII small subunit
MSAKKHESAAKTKVKADTKADTNDNFEQLMKRIEEITGMLEKGDRPLDESIALFEEGMRLFKACQRKLDDAERTVRVLIQEGGREHEQPFPLESQPSPNGDGTDEAAR